MKKFLITLTLICSLILAGTNIKSLGNPVEDYKYIASIKNHSISNQLLQYLFINLDKEKIEIYPTWMFKKPNFDKITILYSDIQSLAFRNDFVEIVTLNQKKYSIGVIFLSGMFIGYSRKMNLEFYNILNDKVKNEQ